MNWDEAINNLYVRLPTVFQMYEGTVSHRINGLEHELGFLLTCFKNDNPSFAYESIDAEDFTHAANAKVARTFLGLIGEQLINFSIRSNSCC